MIPTPPVLESPRHDRRDFIRAFHEHLWRRPDTDRPTVRPQTLVTVAALSALAALVTGVVLHLVRPRSDDAAATASVAASPATFTAMSGWDCDSTADHGFEVGGRTGAWRTVASGGWLGQGCRGSFESVPMLAKDQATGSGQYALWWFHPTASFSRCDLSIYLPDSPDVTASNVRYVVLAGRGGTPIAELNIDQARSRGTWVSAGSYPSGSDGVALELQDAVGSGRLAFAQVTLHCGQ
jgi:hypothetical protein